MEKEKLQTQLKWAEFAHNLNVEWSKSLDQKVGFLLTINGGLGTVLVFLLTDQTNLLKDYWYAKALLGAALTVLMVSFFISIVAINPRLTLKDEGIGKVYWEAIPHSFKTFTSSAENVYLKNLRKENPDLGENVESKLSRIFFVGVASSKDKMTFVNNAPLAYANEEAMLNDLVEQIYINAKIATKKSEHIQRAAGLLIWAVVLIVFASLIFGGVAITNRLSSLTPSTEQTPAGAPTPSPKRSTPVQPTLAPTTNPTRRATPNPTPSNPPPASPPKSP